MVRRFDAVVDDEVEVIALDSGLLGTGGHGRVLDLVGGRPVVVQIAHAYRIAWRQIRLV